MNDANIIDLVAVAHTGCEGFAKLMHDWVRHWLTTYQEGRVSLVSVECREHGANGAMYVWDAE